MIQPVVKLVEQPVRQPAISCIQTFNRLFNWLYEFNLLIHATQHPVGCLGGLTTGWTTGCIV